MPTTTPLEPSHYSRYNDPKWRNVFPLPLSDDFFDLLQDRLSACVENVLFEGDNQFTLFINAIDRKKFQRFRRNESPEFIYAGLTKQRELLRKDIGRWRINSLPEHNLGDAWKTLGDTIISFDRSEVSSSFYVKVQSGTYKLIDTCEINTLKRYFHKPAKDYKAEQAAEKAIIENYFNIDQDVFISVPLIGFGEIDGIVHIVFKKDLIKRHTIHTGEGEEEYFPESLIWILIRSFIVEYDGLFLDWDQVGENIEKITAIYDFVRRTVFEGDEYFDRRITMGKTEILKQLKLRSYYQNHAEYFKKRFDLGENIPGKIYQAYITNAVTAILIDSYAHNVSAHALSTLAWWFYRRADLMRDEELDWSALFEHLSKDPHIDQPLLGDFRLAMKVRAEMRIEASEHPDKAALKWQAEQMEKDVVAIRPEDGKAVIRYPGSLAREMMRLLRFLTEKGAYWSGVTRDVNVGGKVSSLYSILWYDFINNPFYLGTIAKTEDILNIKIRIIIYDDEPKSRRPEETQYHKKHYQTENDGIFAEVDLSNPRENLYTKDAQAPHNRTLSVFVKKGKKFEHFRKRLKAIKIFFPGGVVGRHAFYGMIENEIRNVKHYSHEELREMQKKGLTIAIGIQQCSLHNTINHEIYRISVWLDTPTRLVNEIGDHLINRKWEALDGEIFDKKTYAPLLGGTYQDKVCAGFLLNCNFSHVQSGDRDPDRDKSKDSGRDARYYPWVRPACSQLEEEEEPNTHIDYKLSYNNPLKKRQKKDPRYGDEEEVDTPIGYAGLPKIGYMKKVFYVWRGQFMLEWTPRFAESTSANEASWDNPSRFKIVHLPNDIPTSSEKSAEKAPNPLHTLRRRDGVVRAVKGPIAGNTEEERYAEGYKLWLNTLMNGKPLYAQVIMKEGNQPEYVLALKKEPDSLRFVKEVIIAKRQFNPAIIEVLATTDQKQKGEWEVLIAHRENDTGLPNQLCIRYRNHGIYKSHFLPQNSPILSVDDPVMMELFEVLATKVCIFDNRVHHRMRLDKDQMPGYHTFLRDKLKLSVFKETTPSPETKHATWLSALTEEDLDFVKNCHFLVMHLSFIESILPSKIHDIAAKDRSNVGLFIKEYIMPLVGRRDNFFFVVTTGRGRNEWWTSLDEEEYKDYSTFTIFRAIESLLTAIENSVGMKDDIELKYRIVKILYGS